jgi:hypothetical protein
MNFADGPQVAAKDAVWMELHRRALQGIDETLA